MSYPKQQQLIKMNYIQVNYQTWQRQECYGLFDYSEIKNNNPNHKIIIKSSGTLLRNQLNFQLVFVQNKQKKKNATRENFVPLLRIDQSQGHFFVNDLQQEDREPLCLIVPRKETGHRIKEGDVIRLGKASLEVLRILWKPGKSRNHYEQIQPKMAERQSIFASSFYSQQAKASMLDSNPACRFCYSKTIDQQNPFLAVCDCAGSAKYIHQECLIEWIRKRSGIANEKPQDGVYYAYAKAFTCEVCHALYRMDRLVRRVFEAKGEELQEYVAMRLNCDPAIVFVVDLAVHKEIQIGRSLESTIVVNELSVSRRHCMARVDVEKRALILVDLQAKFGTVVQVGRAEINGQQEYQKGRTKLHFHRQRKVSFFEKIGFCSPLETLKD